MATTWVKMARLPDTPPRARPRAKRQMVMTRKRRLVLALLIEARARGERVTLAEIARRTGLHDYRDARRTVRHLEAMGHSVRDVLGVSDVEEKK